MLMINKTMGGVPVSDWPYIMTRLSYRTKWEKVVRRWINDKCPQLVGICLCQTCGYSSYEKFYPAGLVETLEPWARKQARKVEWL